MVKLVYKTLQLQSDGSQPLKSMDIILFLGAKGLKQNNCPDGHPNRQLMYPKREDTERCTSNTYPEKDVPCPATIPGLPCKHHPMAPGQTHPDDPNFNWGLAEGTSNEDESGMICVGDDIRPNKHLHSRTGWSWWDKNSSSSCNRTWIYSWIRKAFKFVEFNLIPRYTASWDRVKCDFLSFITILSSWQS